MPSRFFCLLLGVSLPWASLDAATVYRSTDAQGNTVFSDRPNGNGERVELEPLTVVPAQEPETRPEKAQSRGSDADVSEASEAPFMPYSTFRIASPQDEATLPTGAGGDVEVELEIEPELREEHRVRLLVDGEISQSAMYTEVIMLTNLNRGEHVLQAELLDAQGRVRHRSAPVTLYVQRASINMPANPNNPANS